MDGYPTVKADRAFKASYQYGVHEFTEGQQLGGHLAQYLLETGAPVTEFDPDAEHAAQHAADEAAAEQAAADKAAADKAAAEQAAADKAAADKAAAEQAAADKAAAKSI